MHADDKTPSDQAKAEMERALRDFDEAQKAGREFGKDPTGRPFTRADIYRTFGEYDRALQEWEKELSAAHQANNDREETYLLIIAGTYYAKVGNISKALEYINKGLELAKKAGNREEEAQAHIELGQIWFMYQRFEDAREHFNEVIAIAKSINNKHYLHLGLGNVGGIYVQRGRYQEAIEVLTQAGGIAQATGDKLHEASHSRNIGMAYFHLREGGKALMHFEYYQQLCQEIGIPPDPTIVKLAQDIRDIYRKRADNTP